MDKNKPNNNSLYPRWFSDWKQTEPILNTYKTELERNEIPRSEIQIMKANQLDSIALDEEIFSLLQAQLFKCFKFFKRSILTDYKPEINCILQLLIYKLSIYDNSASYGQKLQNLIYMNNYAANSDKGLKLWQKLLFGILAIGGKLFWEKIKLFCCQTKMGSTAPSSWQRKANSWMHKIEKAYKTLTLINFLYFFYEGKYISLISRVLGMRLVYSTKNISKSLNFEFMNRQLVWSGFTEFLLVLIPLINFDAIKSYFVRNFVPRKSTEKEEGTGEAEEEVCSICSNVVETSYVTDCKHIFCYYCIYVESVVNDPLSCPRCGKQNVSISRRKYD